MKVDYLIAGQGLGGTILAHQLLENGKKVMIIDEFNVNSSSRIAPGLFNPVTGKKFVKSWQADKLFPFLLDFYKNYQANLGVEFFFPTPVYRPFPDMAAQNDWQGNSAKPSFAPFIDKIFQGRAYDGINDPFGGLLIKGGGFIDLPAMLSRAREKFINDGVLLQEKFDDNLLDIHEDRVKYKNIEAGKMIFCRGYGEAESSFFGWLPFRPVKGEVLSLKSQKAVDKIYIKGCFITPGVDGIHRCGSTYDWRDKSPFPTEKGRHTILGNLHNLIDWKVEIVEQRAGFRPASLDRRPMIGRHPEQKALWVFNGLGAKGVTLAPYYANQLVNFLETGTNLDKEVNIERYYSLYYNSFQEKK